MLIGSEDERSYERPPLTKDYLCGEIGDFSRGVHVQHGVRMMLGEGVAEFEGVGVLERVRTSSNRVIECDLAVIGVGVAPRTELAVAAGLEVENGVLVDERLETSAAGIFAVDDVANAWHPFYDERVRVESWANALNQGPAAARSMLGKSVS